MYWKRVTFLNVSGIPQWPLLFHCTFTWLSMSVVYFDQPLGAAHSQKLVELLFSAIFNLFCSFQTFSVISRLKSTKNIWKRTKNMFLSTPQSWSTCKSWSTPWGGTKGNQSLSAHQYCSLSSSCQTSKRLSSRYKLTRHYGQSGIYSMIKSLLLTLMKYSDVQCLLVSIFVF